MPALKRSSVKLLLRCPMVVCVLADDVLLYVCVLLLLHDFTLLWLL